MVRSRLEKRGAPSTRPSLSRVIRDIGVVFRGAGRTRGSRHGHRLREGPIGKTDALRRLPRSALRTHPQGVDRATLAVMLEIRHAALLVSRVEDTRRISQSRSVSKLRALIAQAADQDVAASERRRRRPRRQGWVGGGPSAQQFAARRLVNSRCLDGKIAPRLLTPRCSVCCGLATCHRSLCMLTWRSLSMNCPALASSPSGNCGSFHSS